MAIKTHLLISLSLAIVALSIAIANAQLSFPGSNPIVGPVIVNINGTVYCTPNGGIGVNGPATPPFADALVQLRDRVGNVLASAITGPNGVFTITTRPSPLGSAILVIGEAQLRVVPPLAQCNSTLPSDRRLVSTRLILRRITIIPPTLFIVPDGFTLSDRF